MRLTNLFYFFTCNFGKLDVSNILCCKVLKALDYVDDSE